MTSASFLAAEVWLSMCNGIIYKVTNKINGKVYIGKTIYNLEKRRKRHESNSLNDKINYYFYRALRKYGWNNFEWEIIDRAKTEKELNLLEILYIEEYRHKGHVYNMTNGGDGVSGNKLSEESRKKMSEVHKGYKHSTESCKKISKAGKGNKYNLGKKHSEKTKRKMSIAHKGNKNGLGYKHTEEVKKNMSAAQRIRREREAAA